MPRGYPMPSTSQRPFGFLFFSTEQHREQRYKGFHRKGSFRFRASRHANATSIDYGHWQSKSKNRYQGCPNLRSISTIDSMTNSSCSSLSRENVRQRIHFGLLSGPF